MTEAKKPAEPGAWLEKYAPREWVQVGLAELRRATAAFESNAVGAGLAGRKRDAGMALTGALRVEPDESWGRSYVDHLRALSVSTDERIPVAVRDACKVLLEVRPPNPHLLTHRVPRGN